MADTTFLNGKSNEGFVGFSNPADIVYLRGSELIDGSVRMSMDLDDNVYRIEKRTNGVYNDDSFRFASNSVELGHDLRMGAMGGFVETLNRSEMAGHLRAVLPHIQFDAQGTTEAAHMPILDKRDDFFVFPAPATGEIISTVIGQVFSTIPTRVLHSSTHITGSAGATAPVQITYYKGTDNTGPILNQFRIPPTIMGIPNVSFTIIYTDDFGFENAKNIFFEYTSANPISLKTNAAGDVITTQNGHVFDELDIMLDEFVMTKKPGFIMTRKLGFVVHKRF